MDKKLAQRKHFPSVNWNISFSKYIRVLEGYFQKIDPSYMALQKSMKEILQKEDALTEIVQLVGKDSLSEDQKCTLEVARIIREDFLQQNGFSEYDYRCPINKTIKMMAVIIDYHDRAQKCIASASGDLRVTWGDIYKATGDLSYYQLTQMKFEMPEKYFSDIKDQPTYFEDLLKAQAAEFDKLMD